MALYDALIDNFGGLPGIRERGVLESALGAPMMAVFGEELHKILYNKAVVYLFNKTLHKNSLCCIIFNKSTAIINKLGVL
jgi:hypothetical protein